MIIEPTKIQEVIRFLGYVQSFSQIIYTNMAEIPGNGDLKKEGCTPQLRAEHEEKNPITF